MRAIFTFLLFCFILSVTPHSYGQVSDPLSIPVYVTPGTITVDGLLNEPAWSMQALHLKYKIGTAPSGFSNTPTGFAIVKEPYTDTSTCYVRFLRSGTNLYISLDSDDKQVCRFDWEGDGLFMKIKDAANAEKEYKLYVGVVGGVPQFVFETNGPAGSSGIGVPRAGTSIYDSTNVDNGYTAELMIDLASLGFTTSTNSLQVLMNIFDPDNYSLNTPPWGPNGNFAKQWWGSEWGPDMRTLQLLSTILPVELTSFTGSYFANSAQLKWSTATEVNNKGFEIERSVGNSEFTTIAFIKGAGTTTSNQSYSYTDENLLTNTNYSYRLKQVDYNGMYSYSDIVELGMSHPAEFELSQNYPNPFNPTTKLSFSLPFNSNVTLEVYNLIGQRVLTLVKGTLQAGTHQVELNASDLNSGVYLYILNASGENGTSFTSSRKMTLLK
jgi:hypothetical protein